MRGRLTALLLLLALFNCVVIADLYARTWPDSMRVMALDLTQPVATPTPGRHEAVPRVAVAEYVRKALDPANPLRLEPGQVGLVRDRATRLLTACRHTAWLQCRLLEALPKATVERFLTLLQSPEARLWGMPGNWDANMQALLTAFPSRERTPYANEVPSGWRLESESKEIARRWSRVFDSIPLGHYVLLESNTLTFLRWLSLEQKARPLGAGLKPWAGQVMWDLCFASQMMEGPWTQLSHDLGNVEPVAPEDDLTFARLLDALQEATK